MHKSDVMDFERVRLAGRISRFFGPKIAISFSAGNREKIMAVVQVRKRFPGLLLLVCMASLFLVASPLQAAPRQTLSPHHIPAAVANLQPVGRLPGSTPMEIGIGLPLRNADALPALVEEIYDPASTNY